MKVEIKSWYTGGVLFSIETDSWKLAVEAAVKGGANLSRADLSRANLSRADLHGAKDIKDILQIGPIGSRRAYLIAILNDKDEIKITAGCWNGTLDEFKARVKEVHGKTQHGKDYMAAIKLIESRFSKEAIAECAGK